MDLGLDPVFLAWARRDGWGLIAMAVHDSSQQTLLKTYTEQHRPSATIASGKNLRQTPINKAQILDNTP